MRSIADADRKALRRSKQVSDNGDDSNGQTHPDWPDFTSNPEQQLLRNEEIAEMRRKVLALFEDDPLARDLVEGRLAGFEGNELRELTGLNEKDFATKLRFIRRRIDKAFPNGWKS
jgi:hypothetical protein